jgi:hypothetical protein
VATITHPHGTLTELRNAEYQFNYFFDLFFESSYGDQVVNQISITGYTSRILSLDSEPGRLVLRIDTSGKFVFVEETVPVMLRKGTNAREYEGIRLTCSDRRFVFSQDSVDQQKLYLSPIEGAVFQIGRPIVNIKCEITDENGAVIESIEDKFSVKVLGPVEISPQFFYIGDDLNVTRRIKLKGMDGDESATFASFDLRGTKNVAMTISEGGKELIVSFSESCPEPFSGRIPITILYKDTVLPSYIAYIATGPNPRRD